MLRRSNESQPHEDESFYVTLESNSEGKAFPRLICLRPKEDYPTVISSPNSSYIFNFIASKKKLYECAFPTFALIILFRLCSFICKLKVPLGVQGVTLCGNQ